MLNFSLREIYCLFKLKSLLVNLTLMNVGEDEIANNLGLLFSVSRRAKRENILLDEVKWEGTA